MKRLLACILITAICICSASSCSLAYKKGKWFSSDTLNEYLIPDMPTLQGDYIKKGDEEIYAKLSVGGFDDYINKLYAYLLSLNFKHFGTRGDLVSSFSGTFYLKAADNVDEFKNEDSYYRFIFSDGDATDKDGNLSFCIVKIRSAGNQTLEYANKTFEYNTVISLHKESESVLGGKYVLPRN